MSAEETVARVDEFGEELVELTLRLASTYSPPGLEAEPAAVVAAWLDENGFEHENLGLPERPNLVVRLPGTDPGRFRSLLFNSHLDEPFTLEDEHLRLLDPEHPKYTSAWREDDRVHGYGAVNDKGPMACWLVAAKALRDAAAPLGGDLVLTAVSGEIGLSPVDEYQGIRWEGTGWGSREVVRRGVRADFALVAEATAFGAAWVEAGKANFKLTVTAGPSRYTPYVPRPVPLAENGNAIVRAAPVALALEDWAAGYQERNTRRYAGGTVVPKANIGCVRSGVPYNLERSPEVLFLYLDVRTLPGADPEAIRAELEGVLAGAGAEGRVEVLSYHAGAESEGVEPLVEAVSAAHRLEFGSEMREPDATTSSMWRDTIPFAEAGIPALTYGPGVSAGGTSDFAIDKADLLAAARAYARVALDVCNRERA